MVKNWTQVVMHCKLHTDSSSCKAKILTHAKHLPFHFETNRAKLIQNRKARTRNCPRESSDRCVKCIGVNGKTNNKYIINYSLLIAVPSRCQTQTPHNSPKCCWKILWPRSQVLALEIAHILQNRLLLMTLKLEASIENMIYIFIGV